MRKWMWLMFPFWFFNHTACFEEGWPGNPAAPQETGVKWHFLFADHGNPIHDEVAGVTLSSGGIPEFDHFANGRFQHLSPGIYLNVGDAFGGPSGTTPFDWGTADQTFEAWYTILEGWETSGPVTLLTTHTGAYGSGYDIIIGENLVRTKLWKGTRPNQTATYTVTTANNPMARGTHKLRITLDRNGDMAAELDTVAQGAESMAATAAWNVTAPTVYLGAATSESYDFCGLLWEMRGSEGLANNSTPVWIPQVWYP